MSDIRIDDLIELIKGWGNPNTLNLHLTPAMMLVDRVSCLEKERDELISKLDKALYWRDDILDIVEKSEGVVGWHQNGDIAEWDWFGFVHDIDHIKRESDDEVSE
jgi:hypothetical protein